MIKPPNWCPDAIPTKKGWVSQKGELLKSQKISDMEILEFNSHVDTPPTFLVESPPSKPMESMSRQELLELTKHHNTDANLLSEAFKELSFSDRIRKMLR